MRERKLLSLLEKVETLDKFDRGVNTVVRCHYNVIELTYVTKIRASIQASVPLSLKITFVSHHDAFLRRWKDPSMHDWKMKLKNCFNLWFCGEGEGHVTRGWELSPSIPGLIPGTISLEI